MKHGKFVSKEDLLATKRKRCESIRKDRLSKETLAEKKFCKILDKEKIIYERQYPIYTNNSFILVDFYIPKKHLAIEIDGSSHDNRRKTWQSYNKWREKVIHRAGAILLRFRNDQVLKNPEDCREIVLKKS